MNDKFYEALRKQRGDWGQVKPYTRIEKNKKKYSRKQKHKQNLGDQTQICPGAQILPKI